MTGSKIIAGSMTPNCIAVVNVLMPICCHIHSGMPNLYIFVEDIFAILGAMTYKWLRKLVCGRNWKLNGHVKFENKNIKAKFIDCDFSVKRVVTFGVVLYRNQ